MSAGFPRGLVGLAIGVAIDADPTVVAILIGALLVLAIAWLVVRVRARGAGDR